MKQAATSMARALVTIVGSYFAGGVPVAYLAGRLLKGIDIRKHGSRNAGASNVWRSVSRWAVVPVGVSEIAQGMAGPLAARRTGQPEGVQALSGLAAIAGHNWSPYLRFTGGRGIDHAIGFMLVLSRPALTAFVAISLTGVVLRKVPQFVGLGVLLAPFVALLGGQSRPIVAGNAGMVALIFTKRLVGNENRLPSGRRAARIMRNRLLYDRDTVERDAWLGRRALGRVASAIRTAGARARPFPG